MLGLLSLATGFFSPYIGDIVGFFKDRQNNAHELEMLKESNASSREIAHLNAQVGMARASTDDTKSARDAQPSYGTALLSAVVKDKSWLMQFFVRPILILALMCVEVANGFMRPYAIYLILTMWASTKVARFYLMFTSTVGGATWQDIASAAAGAILSTWEDHDWAALDYVLGFLLGSRHKLTENGTK